MCGWTTWWTTSSWRGARFGDLWWVSWRVRYLLHLIWHGVWHTYVSSRVEVTGLSLEPVRFTLRFHNGTSVPFSSWDYTFLHLLYTLCHLFRAMVLYAPIMPLFTRAPSELRNTQAENGIFEGSLTNISPSAMPQPALGAWSPVSITFLALSIHFLHYCIHSPLVLPTPSTCTCTNKIYISYIENIIKKCSFYIANRLRRWLVSFAKRRLVAELCQYSWWICSR